MTDLPLISVIVPVYKAEEYLDYCIRSITEQTYENLEILLVDDGSPDRSGEICDRWAAQDLRIRVIHQPNGGGGKARNTALDLARGEFIGMVDSDDYIAPQMYAHLYSLMGEDTDITECAIVPTEDDSCILDEKANGKIRRATCLEAMELHIQDLIFTQTPPNKLYRRSTIGDIRFPEGNLIDDEFFTYRVIGNARNLAHSPARMYAYRQQPGSVMHRTWSLKRLQGIQARKERLEYIREHMPALTYQGRVHLFFSCIYAMQMSLGFLQGEELERARTFIRDTVRELTPLGPSRKISLSMNIWLIMAQISFEGVCKLQNYLDSRNQ